ncbi:long-chain fatty acid--CoA ligase [Heliomicrobium gestii]|nr:AMP-binding protein [Heliomicrobium gestii]MBM7866719.1 acyl-CoA synthetase (AMP-forming)/AMP-acid ligase II [Heliomicrobium gestii]
MFLDWLKAKMAAHDGAEAMIWNGRSYSYRWLLDRIDAWQGELDGALSRGAIVASAPHPVTGRPPITAGMVVAVEGDYTPELCALLLALIDRGVIVVPLTHSVRRQREEFLAIAEAQALFTFDDDDQWRLVWKSGSCWREGDGALNALDGLEPPQNPLLVKLIERGHPGLILFSSGSTGKSKAALHDLTLLMKKFQQPRQSKRMLTFLLLDHIGGFNTLFYVLANAGTIITVPGRTPDQVCANIERYRVEVLPTSPTFLNLLLISEAYRRADLSSLELITYGTEVMPESTLKRLREALPQVRLLQTYGLSELGILRSKSRSSDSLWVRIGGEGFETKVVEGILWIRAESAMLGYLNAPSPFDEEGWFNTQDEVLVDGEYLRILGRRSEIINVGGEKVYPAEVESVLMQMENVVDAVVTGENNPVTGQIVVARLALENPEETAALKRRVRAFCRQRLLPYKVPVKVTVLERAAFSERFKKMRREEQGSGNG